VNVREELKAYYDNELSPAQAEEVRAALNADPEAIRELEEIGRISQVLRTEAVEPEPYGLESTLEALTLGHRKLSPAEAGRRRLGEVLMAVAAVLVVATRLFPVFAQSKSSSKRAAERADMRSMATGSRTMPSETPAMDGFAAGKNEMAKAKSTFGDQSAAALPQTRVPMMNGVQDAASPAMPSLVVKNANLVIMVDSVPRAQATVESLVRGMRGMVQSSNRIDQGGPMSLTLTVRVPVTRFEESLASIRKLGNVVSDNVSGEDVTAAVADADARLKVLRSEEEQYRTLMGRANKIGEILQVKERLGQVREQIESLDAQQRTYRSMAKMSTIDLTLQEKPKTVAAPVVPKASWSQQAWHDATSGIVELWHSFATFGIYLLVFSPVWLPLGLAGWLLYKRRL
jgi:anti-sigma factor RsiW